MRGVVGFEACLLLLHGVAGFGAGLGQLYGCVFPLLGVSVLLGAALVLVLLALLCTFSGVRDISSCVFSGVSAIFLLRLGCCGQLLVLIQVM